MASGDDSGYSMPTIPGGTRDGATLVSGFSLCVSPLASTIAPNLHHAFFASDFRPWILDHLVGGLAGSVGWWYLVELWPAHLVHLDRAFEMGVPK